MISFTSPSKEYTLLQISPGYKDLHSFVCDNRSTCSSPLLEPIEEIRWLVLSWINLVHASVYYKGTVYEQGQHGFARSLLSSSRYPTWLKVISESICANLELENPTSSWDEYHDTNCYNLYIECNPPSVLKDHEYESCLAFVKKEILLESCSKLNQGPESIRMLIYCWMAQAGEDYFVCQKGRFSPSELFMVLQSSILEDLEVAGSFGTMSISKVPSRIRRQHFPLAKSLAKSLKETAKKRKQIPPRFRTHQTRLVCRSTTRYLLECSKSKGSITYSDD